MKTSLVAAVAFTVLTMANVSNADDPADKMIQTGGTVATSPSMSQQDEPNRDFMTTDNDRAILLELKETRKVMETGNTELKEIRRILETSSIKPRRQQQLPSR